MAEPKSPIAIPEVSELSVPVVQPTARKGLAPSEGRADGTVVAAMPARTTSRFSTVGITWATGSDLTSVQAEVRVRQQQKWTGWQPLENEVASAADVAEVGGARAGTAPTWVGDANGVEVRLLNSTRTVPRDVKVSLVDPKAISTDANPPLDRTLQQAPTTNFPPSKGSASKGSAPESRAATQSSSSLPYLYPAPAMVSRKGWGADERLRCTEKKIDTTVKAAIIHHTAGSNSYTPSQSASIVRGIYAYHTKSMGWCDIGYNFLVDKYGTIFEGRFGGIWNPVHGAHATLWNTNTVGVSFMGNFETATPPAAMLEAGARLVAWKLEGNYRNAGGKVTLAGKNINVISGHGDVMQTSCPGKNIRSKMSWFRANVQAKIGSYNTPIYQRWQALGGETGPAGSPFVGEHAKAGGRITNFTNYDMYWSQASGTHWLKGAIRARYRAMSDVSSYLKWPVSDEEAGPLASKRNRFQDGAIYWTSKTGSHDVYRVFYSYYTGLDAKTQGYVGLPIASQRPWEFAGSQLQQFQTAGLFWTRSTGAHAVYRSFYSHYLGMGANRLNLGLPTADQKPGAVAGSQVQRFSKGGLYWTSALKTQAVYGKIYTTYAALGAEKSRLGMPTRGGYAISGGRATDFQHGKITWNSTTGATKVTYR